MSTRPSFTAAQARARLQPVAGRQPQPAEGSPGAPRCALCPSARACIDVTIAAGWEALSCAGCPVAELDAEFAAAVLAEAAVANAQREDDVHTDEGSWYQGAWGDPAIRAEQRRKTHRAAARRWNKRNQRSCACGEKISRKSKQCRSCAGKANAAKRRELSTGVDGGVDK